MCMPFLIWKGKNWKANVFLYFCHSTMNNLLHELKMTPSNLASDMAHGLSGDNSHHILQVLETYDIDVLQQVYDCMRTCNRDLFEVVMKRRMEYVNRVRKNSNSVGGEIDLSRDNTQNLACGISLLSSGMEKINLIIEKKQNALALKSPRNIQQISMVLGMLLICVIVIMCSLK